MLKSDKKFVRKLIATGRGLAISDCFIVNFEALIKKRLVMSILKLNLALGTRIRTLLNGYQLTRTMVSCLNWSFFTFVIIFMEKLNMIYC